MSAPISWSGWWTFCSAEKQNDFKRALKQFRVVYLETIKLKPFCRCSRVRNYEKGSNVLPHTILHLHHNSSFMLNIDSPFSDKQPLYGFIFLCQWMQTSWTDSRHWFHRASAITISDTKCIFFWTFTLTVVASTSLTRLLFLSHWKILPLMIKSLPQVKISPKRRINARAITRLQQPRRFIGFILSHARQEWTTRQEK